MTSPKAKAARRGRMSPWIGLCGGLALAMGAVTGGPVAVPPAMAQSQATPFGGFQHDSTQPIEVASDELEVRNAEQKAIFTGNVRVRQGEVLMKAEWLEVSYAAERGAQRAAEPVAGPLGGGGAIDRLRARGDVIISNGEETARSIEADYQVAQAAIFMMGDVILLQGQNVVKGQRLRIDLTSGTARMLGDGEASAGRVRVQLDPNRAQN